MVFWDYFYRNFFGPKIATTTKKCLLYHKTFLKIFEVTLFQMLLSQNVALIVFVVVTEGNLSKALSRIALVCLTL